MEELSALIVVIICAGAGLLGFQMIKEPEERALLLRVFVIAYAIRIVFTFVIYSVGLADALGGRDDLAWLGAWDRAQRWNAQGPEDLWSSVYSREAERNNAFRYFATWFYYLLGSKSQLALAFVNGFINALTVTVICKAARDFFDLRASTFAANCAIILPAFLVWSSLTLKESWLIFFEIFIFYCVIRSSRDRTLLWGSLAAVLIFLTVGFRVYVGWVALGAACVSFISFRSHNPKRAAFVAIAGLSLLFGLISVSGIVKFDLASLTNERLEEMESFREAVSSSGAGSVKSGVRLSYDTKTLSGAAMQIAVGTMYLLLSPFPWQLGSLRQSMALPDVIFWWILFWGFILPGIPYAWKRHPKLVISISAFIVPLILFYALTFGNIGLVYRQRAQLMPFLLILAAAGYEKRRGRSDTVISNRYRTRLATAIIRASQPSQG